MANDINDLMISECILSSAVSCHTAFVEGYFAEAHASAKSIVKFSSGKTEKFSVKNKRLLSKGYF